MLGMTSVKLFIVLYINLQYVVTPFQSGERNLIEVMSREYSARTFYRLIHEAQLGEMFMEKGPFTLLVPTTEAFSLLNPVFLSDIRRDIGRLQALVKAHIFPGRLLLSNLKDGVSLVSLLGDKLFFRVSRRGVSINGAFVSVADIRASNGVIHILDRVLVYENANGFGNEMERITDKIQSADFQTLRNLLHEARLFDVLTNGGPFTLFAPTEKAVEALNPDFLNLLRKDQAFLRSVLLTHIVPTEIYFPDFLRTEFVQSLNGKVLWLSSGRGGHVVNGSLVLKKDVRASNGVVHVIQDFLLPAKGERIVYPPSEDNTTAATNIIDTLKKYDLNALSKIIDHVTLTQIFNLDGPFTIFAPNDNAFDKLDVAVTTILSKDVNLLRDVVLQHVVRGLVTERELSKGWEGFALNGQNLYSSVLGRGLSISGSTVILANIKAKNGIIHIIDKVVLPPKAQAYIPILRQLEDKGLTIFGEMFAKSGLSNDYFVQGPYTTLIPTDEAFGSLNSILRNRLETDEEFLRRVLLFHMIPGLHFPSHFEAIKMSPTALGGPFRLRVDHNPLRVNGAKVHMTLLNGTNGIVYVVDKVLVPPYPIYNRNSTLQDIFDQITLEEITTMKNLIKKANMMFLLEYNKPYTIFMPSDTAFLSMDPKTEHRLYQEEMFLRDFILYHVIDGKILMKDLVDSHQMLSLNGLPVRFRINNLIPFVNGARFIEQDIIAGNGIINVVDRILLPPQYDVAEILMSMSEVSTVTNIWDSYGLLNVLKNGKDLTLFVPKNEAFLHNSLSEMAMFHPEQAEHLLQKHLLYELDGPCYAVDLCWKEVLFADGTKVQTGIDKDGHITLYKESTPVHIIQENIEGLNGVIHIVDKVL